MIPAAAAARIGDYLAGKLGVPPAREAVAAVPVERLLAAQAELKAELAAMCQRRQTPDRSASGRCPLNRP